MAMRDTVKLHLRISSGNSTLDTEVDGLIASAEADLELSGVTVDESDPLIVRAVCTYAKAQFGYNNPDAERLQKSYDAIKAHLSMAADYKAVET